MSQVRPGKANPENAVQPQWQVSLLLPNVRYVPGMLDDVLLAVPEHDLATKSPFRAHYQVCLHLSPKPVWSPILLKQSSNTPQSLSLLKTWAIAETD